MYILIDSFYTTSFSLLYSQVIESINKCDVDIRRELFSSILVFFYALIIFLTMIELLAVPNCWSAIFLFHFHATWMLVLNCPPYFRNINYMNTPCKEFFVSKL